jgi:trigger factor
VNIQIQDISPTRKSLVVSFDADEVGIEYQAAVDDVSKQVRLPGFRPGKAPAALVLKHYGKNIAENFKQKVVDKAYRDALEETKLNVIQVICVDGGTIAPKQAAIIALTVDLQPSFELPDLAGIPVTVIPEAVTDAEVDAAIDALRGERADLKVVERASQKGDHVKLSYEGTVDGKAILEIAPEKHIYGKALQTWEEVEGEKDGLIPGLGKQLAGLNVAEKKTIAISFPAEFAGAPALAGKNASYAVEILEIRERVLPELNAEFFKSNQVDDLAGLRTKVRNNLVVHKDQENRTGKRRQVVDALLARIVFPVPESLIEQETQSMLRRFMEENMRRSVPQEQFERDRTQLIAGARAAAEKRVRTQMILARIVEQEKLQVDASDIDSFLSRESSQGGILPEKLVKDLTHDRDRLRAVQQSIVFDKALDLVVSKATVSEAIPAAV